MTSNRIPLDRGAGSTETQEPTASATSPAVQRVLERINRPLAVRLVWALRTAVRDDCGAGASRESFAAAQKAEDDLIAEIERLVAAQPATQPTASEPEPRLDWAIRTLTALKDLGRHAQLGDWWPQLVTAIGVLKNIQAGAAPLPAVEAAVTESPRAASDARTVLTEIVACADMGMCATAQEAKAADDREDAAWTKARALVAEAANLAQTKPRQEEPTALLEVVHGLPLNTMFYHDAFKLPPGRYKLFLAPQPPVVPERALRAAVKARIAHHEVKLADDADIHKGCSSMIVSELRDLLAAPPGGQWRPLTSSSPSAARGAA